MRPDETPPPEPIAAAVALGANLPSRLGTPADTLRSVIERLSRAPWTNNFRASSIHTTIPVGPQDQPDYANACAIFETSIDARALMRHLLSIEAECGRSRPDEQRWGPRTLDLDLLLFGDCVLDEPFVTIPHPRMHERLFVLEPLAELCPERMIPGINQTVRDAIERLRTG